VLSSVLPTLAPLDEALGLRALIAGPACPGGEIIAHTCLSWLRALHLCPKTTNQHHREAALSHSDCKIGANESSEASATPEDSTSTMVQWRVGDSVDYEVNGTWYPGYVARSDSKKLYFKYEAAKFKSYEEPIDRASRDDLARLRAGSGSGPPAAAKKKKPARKPAKSPAKKKTVRARRIHSLPLVAREDPLSHRSLNPRPENQRPSKLPSPRPRSPPPRSRASPASRRWRPPPRRRRGVTRTPGAGPRRNPPRRRRVLRRRSRPPRRSRQPARRSN